jgi:mRNA-degrading endonuclease RelE of RelBE toxin-antitoxin system
MVRVEFTDDFKQLFSKIKEKLIKERILKKVGKIKNNPEVGKPMRNVRKGTRELYIGGYRLSYRYFKDKDLVYLLDLYHKDFQ